MHFWSLCSYKLLVLLLFLTLFQLCVSCFSFVFLISCWYSEIISFLFFLMVSVPLWQLEYCILVLFTLYHQWSCLVCCINLTLIFVSFLVSYFRLYISVRSVSYFKVPDQWQDTNEIIDSVFFHFFLVKIFIHLLMFFTEKKSEVRCQNVEIICILKPWFLWSIFFKMLFIIF